MKPTPLVLAASITTLITTTAFAAETGKQTTTQTAPTLAAEAAKPAAGDAAWDELESMLKGPAERPKSREEATEIFKKHFSALDEKAAAWTAANPKDPRRWKLAQNTLQTNRVRGMVGLPQKSPDDMKKLAAEILAAPDADKETKGFASFLQVMEAEGDGAQFAKLAEAHMKAYPDFTGNRQIENQLKRIEAEKELKSKPLDLKFTAVDGREVDMEKLRGKVVLIDFWATWCGPCVAEIPNVVAAYEKLNPKGFEIVGISFDNADDKEKLIKFTADKKMPWPQHFDGKGWKNEFGVKYGINSIPRMWLVDKKGMVVDTNGRADLAGKVEKLLAE